MLRNAIKSMKKVTTSGARLTSRSVKQVKILNIVRPVVSIIDLDATVPKNICTGSIGSVSFTLDEEELEEEGGRRRGR